MPISIKHPEYSRRHQTWQMMRDLYDGEEAVKDKTTHYLPATSSMIIDGMDHNDIGLKRYEAYLGRAVLYDFVKDGVEKLVGLMHQKDPNIALPEKMEFLRESATSEGESLTALLRRINTEQMITGRLGLMPDFTSGVDPRPYISVYHAESIINWDDSRDQRHSTLNMVVLDESDYERSGLFEWEMKRKYRVLSLGDFRENEQEAHFMSGLFRGDDAEFDESLMEEVVLKGKKFNEIPFTFVNTRDVLPKIDQVPLYGLARLTLTIYRGEADYRQTLFMQGDETLVIIGAVDPDKATRTGAGAKIDVDIGGDAKYIGVSSSGLSEQRQALENDKKIAEMKSGNLISPGRNQESGHALTTRLSAQTASLNQIAKTGAFALQRVLRYIAQWMDLDPEEVVIEPNLEFADIEMNPGDIGQLMMANIQGAPLSRRSIHNLMVERGITKYDFETELEYIEEERELGGLGGFNNDTDDSDIDDSDDDDDDV